VLGALVYYMSLKRELLACVVAQALPVFGPIRATNGELVTDLSTSEGESRYSVYIGGQRAQFADWPTGSHESGFGILNSMLTYIEREKGVIASPHCNDIYVSMTWARRISGMSFYPTYTLEHHTHSKSTSELVIPRCDSTDFTPYHIAIDGIRNVHACSGLC